MSATSAASIPLSRGRRFEIVHSEMLWVGAATLVALAVRVWLLRGNSGLTMDAPEYVRIADELAAHGRSPASYQNHGYPLVTLAARLFEPDPVVSARMVSLLAGLALVPLVHRLARRTLAFGWALLASALVAAHPLLAVYSGAVMSDSLFLAATFGALLLAGGTRPGAGGALLGLAFWVRPEAAAIALGAIPGLGRRRWLAFLGVAVAIAVVYVGYLRWERGVWTPTPKLESQTQSERHEFRIRDLLGPDASGAAPGSARAPWVARFASHAAEVVEVWPWPLLALSVLGWSRRRRLLAAPFALLLVLPFLADPPDARHVLVLIPSLAVLAAAGAARVATVHPRVLVAASVLVVAAGMGLAWRGRPGLIALHFDDGPMRQMREAGEWLRAHAPPGAAVMDRKAYVPFFAHLRHEQLPDEDVHTLIEWARLRRIRYLVVEEYVAATFRPQLLPLIANRAARESERSLRTVYAHRDDPGTGIAIFEIAPF